MVDVVVVPRDRFSTFPQCIDAIYACTRTPFRLIIVAGGMDRTTEVYLRGLESARDNVTLVAADRLLLQGEARNLGLREVSSRWCVAIENDTIVGGDWLTPLLECVRDEGAAVVTPMIMWYRGVHAVGCFFEESAKDGTIVFRHHIAYAASDRRCIDYPENHCLLIDRAALPDNDLFDDVEPFDVDLGMMLRRRGLTTFVEPRSVVTYAAPPPLEVRDVPSYRFRWDPASWAERNREFARKWGVRYDPTSKLASYRRQQLKLGPALWHANRATVAISNVVAGMSQKLLSTFMRPGASGYTPPELTGHPS